MKKLGLLYVLLFSLLVLASCGDHHDDDDGGNVQQQQAEKSIFSVWKERNGFTLDFSRGAFDSPREVSIFSRSGEELCSCTILISGAESAGTIDISSCTYTGSDFPVPEPGCEEFENNDRPYTYTKSDSTLVICATFSNCDTFQ